MSNHDVAKLEATILKDNGDALTGKPRVPVHFEVTPVASSEEGAAAVSEADTVEASGYHAVGSYTKHVIANAEGKAVLPLHNPKGHSPGTYKVVAKAKSIKLEEALGGFVPVVTFVKSNRVLVTWEGHHGHNGDYGHGEHKGHR